MKLVIQFSPSSHYFPPTLVKYSTPQPFLKILKLSPS